MKELLYEETKHIVDPNSLPNLTELMYDVWKGRMPHPENHNRPYFGDLKAGSDFVAFHQRIGKLK